MKRGAGISAERKRETGRESGTDDVKREKVLLVSIRDEERERAKLLQRIEKTAEKQRNSDRLKGKL